MPKFKRRLVAEVTRRIDVFINPSALTFWQKLKKPASATRKKTKSVQCLTATQ